MALAASRKTILVLLLCVLTLSSGWIVSPLQSASGRISLKPTSSSTVCFIFGDWFKPKKPVPVPEPAPPTPTPEPAAIPEPVPSAPVQEPAAITESILPNAATTKSVLPDAEVLPERDVSLKKESVVTDEPASIPSNTKATNSVTHSEKIRKGSVLWFDRKRGFGIIRPLDGADVFVHQTAIQMQGFRFLRTGQSVEFVAEYDEKRGSEKAVKVTGPGGEELS